MSRKHLPPLGRTLSTRRSPLAFVASRPSLGAVCRAGPRSPSEAVCRLRAARGPQGKAAGKAGGPVRPHGLPRCRALVQVSAVQQALQLLSQSLEDMDLAATAITASRALDDVGSVAQTVARADARAEDTARMARQLLGVLREVRGLGHACMGEQSSMPVSVLEYAHATACAAVLPRAGCPTGMWPQPWRLSLVWQHAH